MNQYLEVAKRRARWRNFTKANGTGKQSED